MQRAIGGRGLQEKQFHRENREQGSRRREGGCSPRQEETSPSSSAPYFLPDPVDCGHLICSRRGGERGAEKEEERRESESLTRQLEVLKIDETERRPEQRLQGFKEAEQIARAKDCLRVREGSRKDHLVMRVSVCLCPRDRDTRGKRRGGSLGVKEEDGERSRVHQLKLQQTRGRTWRTCDTRCTPRWPTLA